MANSAGREAPTVDGDADRRVPAGPEMLRASARNLLAFAAIGEGLFGLALAIAPSTVVPLLFAGQVSGAGLVMGRFAGIALMSLGTACWPGRSRSGTHSASLPAMLAYSVAATVYLAWVALAGELVGVLLWPAATVHFVLTILLVWTWFKQ